MPLPLKNSTSFLMTEIKCFRSQHPRSRKPGLPAEAHKKFISLSVVDGLISPLTFRSTMLPFKSKMYLRLSGFFNYKVFSINIRCTSYVWLVLTVKTPNTFIIRLSGTRLQCSARLGSMPSIRSNSPFVIVFIMNFLSWLKKKKLPLLPAPSPALNTQSLFSSGLKLFSITFMLVKYSENVYMNSSLWWKVTWIFDL